MSKARDIWAGSFTDTQRQVLSQLFCRRQVCAVSIDSGPCSNHNNKVETCMAEDFLRRIGNLHKGPKNRLAFL